MPSYCISSMPPKRVQSSVSKKGPKRKRPTNTTKGPPLVQHEIGEDVSLPALIQQAVAAAVQGAMPTLVAHVTNLLEGGGRSHSVPSQLAGTGVSPDHDTESWAHTVTSLSTYGQHLTETDRRLADHGPGKNDVEDSSDEEDDAFSYNLSQEEVDRVRGQKYFDFGVIYKRQRHNHPISHTTTPQCGHPAGGMDADIYGFPSGTCDVIPQRYTIHAGVCGPHHQDVVCCGCGTTPS